MLTVKIEVSFTIQLELGYIKSYCCTYMVYMYAWRVIVIQRVCAAHIGMDGIRIEKEPRQETNM